MATGVNPPSEDNVLEEVQIISPIPPDLPKEAPDEPPTCCICLENINKGCKIDCCTHQFCFDCIYKWSKVSNTCPLCQVRFNSLQKTWTETEPASEMSNEANKKKRPRRSQRIAEKEGSPTKMCKTKDDIVHVPNIDHRSQPNIRMFLGREDQSGLLANFINSIIFRNRHHHHNVHHHTNSVGSSETTPIDLTQDSDDDIVEIQSTIVEDGEGFSDDESNLLIPALFFPMLINTLASNRMSTPRNTRQPNDNRRGSDRRNDTRQIVSRSHLESNTNDDILPQPRQTRIRRSRNNE